MDNIVLAPNQILLLPLLKLFQKDFYLVGGTAIALFLGHRKSIDFDLFSALPLRHTSLLHTLKKNGYTIEHTLVNAGDELTIIVGGVKLTFLTFPFEVHGGDFLIDSIIRSPDLLTLASMKAYAMGRRSKWKDYVDMYFLLRQFTVSEVSDKARNIFGGAFEEKLFREQLCYFEDIDYTEEVEYIGEGVPQKDIEIFLTRIATKIER